MKSPMLLICRAILLLGAACPLITRAQEAPLPQGGTATPAQLEAEKKVALEFFRPGISLQELVALVDPSYVQHNPLVVKTGADNHLSDYEEFKRVFAGIAIKRGAGGPNGLPDSNAPQPAIVMAEGDLVTVIFKHMVQDPTAAPGTKYAAFTWDTFRVRNGKLVEHWDGATISVKAVAAVHAMEALADAPGGPSGAPPAAPVPSTQK